MDDAKIEQIINRHQGDAAALIQVLLEIQHENHWLPKEALEKVSEKLEVPLSKVVRTATFFKAFSINPEARHEIHVCNGTTCHVRGTPRLLDKVEEITGVKAGETHPDLKFSLNAVTCLGACASGPMVIVDGKTYARMDPTKAEDVLKNCD